VDGLEMTAEISVTYCRWCNEVATRFVSGTGFCEKHFNGKAIFRDSEGNPVSLGKVALLMLFIVFFIAFMFWLEFKAVFG
jgi:hypothetical protein